MCVGLGVSDLRDIPQKINTMSMMTESYPAMEKVCIVFLFCFFMFFHFKLNHIAEWKQKKVTLVT